MNTKHRQNVHQWNPPKLRQDSHAVFDSPENIVSATECTGLIQQPLDDLLAAQEMSSLYAIHQQKPQGNVGKGNPRNDLGEIAFHRGPGDPPTHRHLPQENK